MKDKNLPFLFLHKKKKARGFSERLGNGVGLRLVTALRFTRALSKTKG